MFKGTGYSLTSSYSLLGQSTSLRMVRYLNAEELMRGYYLSSASSMISDIFLLAWGLHLIRVAHIWYWAWIELLNRCFLLIIWSLWCMSLVLCRISLADGELTAIYYFLPWLQVKIRAYIGHRLTCLMGFGRPRFCLLVEWELRHGISCHQKFLLVFFELLILADKKFLLVILSLRDQFVVKGTHRVQ